MEKWSTGVLACDSTCGTRARAPVLYVAGLAARFHPLAKAAMVGSLLTMLTSSHLSGASQQESPGAFTATLGHITVRLNRKDGSLNLQPTDATQGRPFSQFKPYARDFKTKTNLLQGLRASCERRDALLTCRWHNENEGFALVATIRVGPNHVFVTLQPELAAPRPPLQLELGLEGELSFDPAAITYWDGNKTIKNTAAVHLRNKWTGTFPLACVYNDRTGWAVGNAATDILSYLENGFQRGEDGKLALHYGTRFIVDNKIKDSLTLILFPFDPEYGGFKVALQHYYDAYPECFAPKPDVNPKLSLGSACNITWSSGRMDYPPVRLEQVRRFYGDWAWAYAPFRRTGDLYGERDLWDYKPVRPFEAIKATALPWDQFHAFRRERFELLHGEVANCLHQAFMYCEQQLVKEKFPDAQVTPEMDPEATTVYNQPWVTGHDNEYKVFPYQTSYEPFLKEGLAKLVKEIDVYGWAFDCGEDVGKYRGPALDRCPGRAFDEKGPYVDVAVAMADLMDYMHTLRRNGYRTGIIGNFGMGVFPVCFRTDAVIYENPPYKEPECAKLVRYFSGRKTICWWRDYDVDRMIDWESMSPEEITEAFRAVRDNVLLSSFQLGGIPPSGFLIGVPKLMEFMPLLQETVRLGWEPLVPVKTHAKLWLSRYGQGAATAISLGNPTTGAITNDVRIRNSLLGNQAYAFAAAGGPTTRQTIGDSFTTLPNVVIPPRTPLILRAEAGFKPQGKVTVFVATQKDAFQALTRLRIETKGSFETPLTLRPEPGYHLDQVTVNGSTVSVTKEAPSGVQFTVALKSGLNFLKATRRSDVVQRPEKAILEFPALKDGRLPNCSIVYPANDADAKRLALRCQDYFRYYGETRVPLQTLELPVVSDQTVDLSGNLIVVDVGRRCQLAPRFEQRPDRKQVITVARQGERQILYVGGADPAATRDALLQLLRIWDRAYVYYGRFPDTTYLYMYQRPDGNFAAKQAGLVGKLLQ